MFPNNKKYQKPSRYNSINKYKLRKSKQVELDENNIYQAAII